MGSNASIPTLIELLKDSERNQRTRCAAAAALGRSKRDDAGTALTAVRASLSDDTAYDRLRKTIDQALAQREGK
jgi:HEAT repeat protein